MSIPVPSQGRPEQIIRSPGGTIQRSVIEAPPRIQSHAHAAQTLDDTRYLVYCLVSAAKHLVSLMCKRWPELK